MYYTAEEFIKYSHFKLQNPSKSMLLQTDIHIVFLLLKKKKKESRMRTVQISYYKM